MGGGTDVAGSEASRGYAPRSAALDGLRTAPCTSIAQESDASWENELLSAFDADAITRAGRDGVVNEQLLELDWRGQRWARVPRVCASVATSGGFLFCGHSASSDRSTPGRPGGRAGGSERCADVRPKFSGGRHCRHGLLCRRPCACAPTNPTAPNSDRPSRRAPRGHDRTRPPHVTEAGMRRASPANGASRAAGACEVSGKPSDPQPFPQGPHRVGFSRN